MSRRKLWGEQDYRTTVRRYIYAMGCYEARNLKLSNIVFLHIILIVWLCSTVYV